MMTTKTTYSVLIRRTGTANRWINWCPDRDDIEEALLDLRDALAHKGEAKIKENVSIVPKQD